MPHLEQRPRHFGSSSFPEIPADWILQMPEEVGGSPFVGIFKPLRWVLLVQLNALRQPLESPERIEE
jgi:hypothetical protein